MDELLIECVATVCVGPFAISVVYPFPLRREMGLDPGVFGRFDLAALVQSHLKFLFVCLVNPKIPLLPGVCRVTPSPLWRKLHGPPLKTG